VGTSIQKQHVVAVSGDKRVRQAQLTGTERNVKKKIRRNQDDHKDILARKKKEESNTELKRDEERKKSEWGDPQGGKFLGIMESGAAKKK